MIIPQPEYSPTLMITNDTLANGFHFALKQCQSGKLKSSLIRRRPTRGKTHHSHMPVSHAHFLTKRDTPESHVKAIL